MSKTNISSNYIKYLGGWFEKKNIFPYILGISSSQLTNSYFSERWLNHQSVFPIRPSPSIPWISQNFRKKISFNPKNRRHFETFQKKSSNIQYHIRYPISIHIISISYPISNIISNIQYHIQYPISNIHIISNILGSHLFFLGVPRGDLHCWTLQESTEPGPWLFQSLEALAEAKRLKAEAKMLHTVIPL